MKFKRRNYDLKKRNYYKKTELLQKMLKTLLLYNQNIVIQLAIKKYIKSRFNTLGYLSSIKNYCIISGRSRSVYKSFKVSRLVLKELNIQGLFFGLKKAS